MQISRSVVLFNESHNIMVSWKMTQRVTVSDPVPRDAVFIFHIKAHTFNGILIALRFAEAMINDPIRSLCCNITDP